MTLSYSFTFFTELLTCTMKTLIKVLARSVQKLQCSSLYDENTIILQHLISNLTKTCNKILTVAPLFYNFTKNSTENSTEVKNKQNVGIS